MSWWQFFESEVPNLQRMGITQVWLPPPNKAMKKVRFLMSNGLETYSKCFKTGQGYDAYDLVCISSQVAIDSSKTH